jgi:hypothetical protein
MSPLTKIAYDDPGRAGPAHRPGPPAREGLISMTDRVTSSYLDRCLAGDRGLLDVMKHARARFPAALAASCGDQLLPRPMFMDQAEMQACADALIRLFDLLVSLPDRLFDGDFGRYCQAINISPRNAALIKRFPGPPALYGRADMYHDGHSLKLLEYNLDSVIGGTERSEISRLLLEVDAFRDFAGEHGLCYVHTGERVAQVLRQAAEPVTGGGTPVVAYVEWDGVLAGYMHLVLSFQEMMKRLGLDLVIGEISQLRSKAGRLFLHGKPVDVVLRYFSIDDITASPRGEDAVEPIFRAHEEGKVVLWTTMRSWQVFSKGCLALLSGSRSRDAFSPQERDLIDSILPWTRALANDAGDCRDVIDQCRDNRDDLILKPYGGYGGVGIIAGWKASDREWKQALLRAARDGGYVVQRRVVPRNEPVVNPATGAVENWLAVWDTYLTPGGYAGSRIRSLPAGDHGVINMKASDASRTTGVFCYPAAPPTRKTIK